MRKNLIINIVYDNIIVGQAIFDSRGTTDEAYHLLRPVVETSNNINGNKTQGVMIAMTNALYGGTINKRSQKEKAVLMLQASGAELASIEEIDFLVENEANRLQIPVFLGEGKIGKIYLNDILYHPDETEYMTITLNCTTGMVFFSVFDIEDAAGMESLYGLMDDYGLDLDYFDSIFIDDIREVIQNLPLICNGKLISRIEGV